MADLVRQLADAFTRSSARPQTSAPSRPTDEQSSRSGRQGFGGSFAAPRDPADRPKTQLSTWNTGTSSSQKKREQEAEDKRYQEAVEQAHQPNPTFGQLLQNNDPAQVAVGNLEQGEADDRAAARNAEVERQAQALGLRRGLPGGFRAEEMTWEQYGALNPQQRAVVDANTAIVQAVNADKLALEGEARGTTGDESYLADVKAMFGEAGGSDTYAPRTVAVLKALGLEDTKTGDLDNFLNLSALVTEADMGSLTGQTLDQYRDATPDEQENVRTVNALRLSETASGAIARSLQAGQELLDLARNSTEDTTLFGEPTAPVGYNPTNERDVQLNRFFELLALKDSDLTGDEIRQTVDDFGAAYNLDGAGIQKYFETRLREYEYNSALGQQTSLGGDPALQYLTPAEFRQRYYVKGEG